MRPTEEISKLKERVAELEAWKESALAVEREWDEQAVGRELRVPLGASIRRAVGIRVPILVHALERIADEDHLRDRAQLADIAYMALWKAGIRK